MSLPTKSETTRVLVIDDEPDLRTLYELTLLREGYHVDAAACVAEARELLDANRFDVVITDMRLPDGMGTEVLHLLRKLQRNERCIVITAYGSAENAVESLKAGAFDYLTKPVDLKQFRQAVAAAAKPGLQIGAQRTSGLPLAPPQGEELPGTHALNRLIGDSVVMRQVKERILKVAGGMAPILICGESGTGKELVAQALHAVSHRAGGPWVPVNCGAIPENLLEAEFFGARKGAFTGASHDRDGFFKAAHGGTLFLDEIGEIPLSMQAKLLRAIQERTIRPLGATQEEVIDVRIISATHKNLPDEIAAGRFRQDLYYRINVIDINLPPLRERPEDLSSICHALLARIAKESGEPAKKLSGNAMHLLAQMPLRGNVRELENLLYRAVALSEGDMLELDTAAPAEKPPAFAMPASVSEPVGKAGAILPTDLQRHLDDQERDILVRALKETGFNRTLAAKQLGLTLRQIRYRIARLKIDAPDIHNDDDPDT